MAVTVELDIDDELLAEVEAKAQELGISRDEFFVDAVRRYIRYLDESVHSDEDAQDEAE